MSVEANQADIMISKIETISKKVHHAETKSD